MITTLIFDLDGLLADTEILHRQATQEVLATYDIDLSDQHYNNHWVRDGKGIGDFISGHKLALDPEIIRLQKGERYEALVRSNVQPMPGALPTLARLHPHKTFALATSSQRESAFAVIETLNIKDYFSCIATKADAKRMKPFPDIFQFVAARLDVSPSQCLVLEDAEKGILAANAAGIQSIAIPNDQTKHNDFSEASLLLPSLDHLTLEVIKNLNP